MLAKAGVHFYMYTTDRFMDYKHQQSFAAGQVSMLSSLVKKILMLYALIVPDWVGKRYIKSA